MRERPGTKLFGTKTKTDILLFIRALGSTYGRQIASALSLSPSLVQDNLDDLENDGIITRRLIGRTKLVELNRRFSAYSEMTELLEKLLLNSPDIITAASKVRKRPRRKNKEI